MKNNRGKLEFSSILQLVIEVELGLISHLELCQLSQNIHKFLHLLI